MNNVFKLWDTQFKGTRGERACIRKNKWDILYKTISNYNVQTVLEFGSGLSTVLMNKLHLDIDSYEDKLDYMYQVKILCNDGVNFHLWDNKVLNINKHYDFALVDGEVPRKLQGELAFANADIVAIDDSRRGSSRGITIPDNFEQIYNGEVNIEIFRRKELKKWPAVSIIIAHRNDFPMLGITVRSILEELRNLDGGGEIIICDNSEKKHKHLLANVINKSYIEKGIVKIIHQDFPCLASARDSAAEIASSKYLISLDSHMIIGRDMIKDLVNFIDSYKENDLGFVHAPIVMVHQGEEHKRHEFQIKTYYNKPHLTGLKGMPWICKKSFWDDIKGYGFVSNHKMAWGGAEIYLAIKAWMLGYNTYGIPCRPGIHIGPYRNMKDFIRYRMWGKSGEHGLYFTTAVCSYIFGETSFPNKVMNIQPASVDRYDNSFFDKAIELGKEEKLWFDKKKVRSLDSFFEAFPHLLKTV